MPSLFDTRPVTVRTLREGPTACCALPQVGSFPNWDVWGEWNGRFRDDVRRFIKGDQGCKPAFATRLAGSADLYHVNKRRVPPEKNALKRSLAEVHMYRILSSLSPSCTPCSGARRRHRAWQPLAHVHGPDPSR